MQKIILILTVIILFGRISVSQIKPDAKEVDAKTFALYTAGKWDALADECERALDRGIDFFFLRLRAGIAYYKNEDYLSAIPHFEKALKYSPADPLTMEYLYYSYLFSGRESDVLALVYVMPLKLKKQLRINSKFIYGIYAEGGYTFNMDFSKQKKKNELMPSIIYNEQNVVDNGTYVSFNLKHQLGKNIKIFHGYNNITITSTKQISEQTQAPKSYESKSTQDEYYLNANFNLGKGFDLITAFHYIRVSSENYSTELSNVVNPPVTAYVNIKEKFNDFVGLVSLSMYAGHFKLALKNSVSNLNKATQIQNTAQVIFFPLGNLNFYTVTNATLFTSKDWGSKYDNTGILDQNIGWKVFDNLWMEAGYTFGKIFNFNESDAYIVFNNTDKITNRITLNFIAPVSRHIELSLRYQYYNQEISTLNLSNQLNKNTISTNNKLHKIIGGLKWTF